MANDSQTTCPKCGRPTYCCSCVPQTTGRTPTTKKVDPTVDRESVIVRLTLLTGGCRQPRITKKQIEDSLQRYIKELADG